MSEQVTTGVWQVNPAKEADFVRAWAEFARQASTNPGATTLRLGRDLGAEGRYVSYAAWKDAESAHAWKTGPHFQEQIAQVLQYVDDFRATELAVVATASDGTSTSA